MRSSKVTRASGTTIREVKSADESVMTLWEVLEQGIGMKVLLRTLVLPVLLLASCGGGVATSPTTSPAVAPATSTSTPAPLATVASPSPVTAASDCTSTASTTRQVVERLFVLSTSNDARAVTDCFSQSYRDKNANFAQFAGLWSREGPATNLVVTPVDTVNGCDRFRATAQMPNNPFWTSGQQFYSVGPEVGRPRIYDSGTALANAAATTTHCP